jgi:hypothetical protein
MKLALINDLLASKQSIEASNAKSIVKHKLEEFKFEIDYLEEGEIVITHFEEVTFHSCTLENFIETRHIKESAVPNRNGVSLDKKRISDYNVWEYSLGYEKKYKDSSNSLIIDDSHHAIGCSVCKQHGKVRCSTCRGQGENTCENCNGRGENRCRSCSGSGEKKCWSCSGKGIKETGYGDNKRTERCSSCGGRGRNPCSECRQGYITCSKCSGRGKQTCYTCSGSGEVTCYECHGYRTMDHYFSVVANYTNKKQQLNLTNPFVGFNHSMAENCEFSISKKLCEFEADRFTKTYFNEIMNHLSHRSIDTFFQFANSDDTKLLSSRLTVFENVYHEIFFEFYGEKYQLITDRNNLKSYFIGKKPTDQYEIDLLKKSLGLSKKNDLVAARKNIQKFSEYGFLEIGEKKLLNAIDDTLLMYDAIKFYHNKNFQKSEGVLKLVSGIKKGEADLLLLKSKLNAIYLKNTLLTGILMTLLTSGIIYFIYPDITFIQFGLSIILVGLSVLINRISRNYKMSLISPPTLILICSIALSLSDFNTGLSGNVSQDTLVFDTTQNVIHNPQDDDGEYKNQVSDLNEELDIVAIAASSTMVHSRFNFSPNNIYDDDLGTWWSPSNSTDDNTWVEFELGGNYNIGSMRILNGSHGQYYNENSVITQLEVEFSDGSSELINLEVVDEIQNINFQKIYKANRIKCSVKNRRVGNQWDDICISHMRFIGDRGVNGSANNHDNSNSEETALLICGSYSTHQQAEQFLNGLSQKFDDISFKIIQTNGYPNLKPNLYCVVLSEGGGTDGVFYGNSDSRMLEAKQRLLNLGISSYIKSAY